MAADEGPEEAGVRHINEFGKEKFNGVMHCSWMEMKGRVLHATRSYRPGEVIFVESPLHIVQENEKCAPFKKLKKLCRERADDFDYEPLWYWCAIQSLTTEQLKGAKVDNTTNLASKPLLDRGRRQCSTTPLLEADGCTGCTPETQRNLLLLHHEEVLEPSTAAEIIASEIVPGADPVTIERLIQIWVLNCFEYSDSPQGYSTYFYSSFMSHSCFPNAVWHYSGADHVLRSRREIKEGDEVCISYLPESGLLQSAPSRRMELNETKRFWCDCERCIHGISDMCRGMKCQKCSEGTVFAHTPVAGAAKDGSLLATQFQGALCTSCKKPVTKAEAAKLAALEEQLQEIVDKCTEADTMTVKQLQADEAFIDEHFSQHVLADLAWEQFGSHYVAKKKGSDQRRLLQRRCAFHKAAYPGLSGAHAWALEALGDCMRGPSGDSKASGEGAAAKDSKEDSSKKGKGTGSPKANQVARENYAEALAVLRLMFGDEHEYVTDVQAKQAAASE